MPLSSITEICRGLSITPTYLKKTKGSYEVPILKGNNIKKSQQVISQYIDRNYIIKKFGKKSALLKQKKIMLQNIFSSESGLISTIDLNGYYTLDTVTNIFPKKILDLFYLFGLLNSKLINFYLITGIYQLSTLTMHTDKAYVGQIPIKKYISPEERKEIIRISKKMFKSGFNKSLLRELDSIIYRVYDIGKNEQLLIDATLGKIMSAKSKW